MTIIKEIALGFRLVRKHALFSVINLIGLSVGFSVALGIFLYISDDLGYDRMFLEKGEIYRVATQTRTPDGEAFLASSPRALYAVLEKDFPGISAAVSISNGQDAVVKTAGGDLFFEKAGLYTVSAHFRQVFPLHLKFGNPDRVLANPQEVSISSSVCEKYFGKSDPVGKSLTINGQDWLIGGVHADIPRQSHLPEMALVIAAPAIIDIPDLREDWICVKTYFKTNAPVKKENLEKLINDYLRRESPKQNGQNPAPMSFRLQPLQTIHLYSHCHDEFKKPSNPALLWGLVLIGAIVLGLAVFNFINLATAQFLGRAREIGIRRISGATRTDIFRQFMIETACISVIAFLAGLVLVELFLPLVNQSTNRQLELAFFRNGWLDVGAISLLVMITLLAGSYPVWLASSVRLMDIMKNRLPWQYSRHFIRNSVVIFQFTMAIILICLAMLIYHQVNFMKTKAVGFNPRRVLVIPAQSAQMARAYKTLFPTIQTELTRNPAIICVTSQLNPPGQMGNYDVLQLLDEGGQKELFAAWQFVDENYFRAYEMPQMAGQNFVRQASIDGKNAFIINETAVRKFGWSLPEQALGKRLKLWMFEGPIVGVVRDFHYQSLHSPIGPVAYCFTSDFFPESISLKLSSNDNDADLNFIKGKWREFFPNNPFEYFWLSDVYDRFYQSEEQISCMTILFAGLALVIACLGLFGLAANYAKSSTKEIGVRKVMGAHTAEITLMIIRKFIVLILIAMVLACPLAWYLMRLWLLNFAYRVPISIAVFLYAGFCGLAVALLTIGFQVWKAATANPVDSLKYE